MGSLRRGGTPHTFCMIQSTDFKTEAHLPICWSPRLQVLQKDRHNDMQSDALQVKDVYSGFGQGYVQDVFQKVSILCLQYCLSQAPLAEALDRCGPHVLHGINATQTFVLLSSLMAEWMFAIARMHPSQTQGTPASYCAGSQRWARQ